MQLFHDTRLILPAAAAAADADGSGPPGKPRESAPAFAAVFGGFPAISPPADRPGTALAGSTGEGVPRSLTGKLLPPLGSPLPAAQAGGEQALLDAHLPDAPVAGAGFAPYSPQPAASPASLDIVVANGRLGVAAGDASDRLTPPARAPHANAPGAALTTAAAAAAERSEIAHPVAGAASTADRHAASVSDSVSAEARALRPFTEWPAAQTQRPAADRSGAGSSGEPANLPTARLADRMAQAPRHIDPADTRAGSRSAGREAQIAPLAQASRRRAAGRFGFEHRSRDAAQRSPMAERPMPPDAAPSVVTSGALRAELPDGLRWRQAAGSSAVSLRLDAASTTTPGTRFVPDLAATVADTANPASDTGTPRWVSAFAPAPAAVATVPGVAAAFTVEPPVLDPAWQTAVGERVVWMAARGLQHAELRLNPAELGPMQLQVSVDDGRVSVSITALQAATRDALEAAVPRLRELLEENGMDLAGADVSGGGVEQQSRDGGLERTEDLVGLTDGSDLAAAEEHAPATAGLAGRSGSAVDLYA